jgi:hypothetical protein
VLPFVREATSGYDLGTRPGLKSFPRANKYSNHLHLKPAPGGGSRALCARDWLGTGMSMRIGLTSLLHSLDKLCSPSSEVLLLTWEGQRSHGCQAHWGRTQRSRARSEQTANSVRLPVMDEGRKRVVGIMAAILASLHMQTADDLFGGPQGSPRSDKLISASIQWAERIMEKIDNVFSSSDLP